MKLQTWPELFASSKKKIPSDSILRETILRRDQDKITSRTDMASKLDQESMKKK